MNGTVKKLFHHYFGGVGDREEKMANSAPYIGRDNVEEPCVPRPSPEMFPPFLHAFPSMSSPDSATTVKVYV